MPTGTSIVYVAGGDVTPRDLPIAERAYVRVHEPVCRTSGLDFAALSPACAGCGVKSSEVGTVDRLCPGCREPEKPAVRPTPAPVVEKPRKERAASTPKPQRGTTDTAAILAAYTAGDTISQVARDTGHARNTVRRTLVDAGVEIRDDRANNGGHGLNRIDRSPEFIAHVRDLYVDQHLALAEIGRRLRIGPRTARAILEQQGVTIRPPAVSPPEGDPGPAPQTSIRDRITALGATSSDVKAWAVREGLLMEMQPGLPPARVVDAYAAAHGPAADLSEQREALSA